MAHNPDNELAELRQALEPLRRIADAYDANELDDEARKFWGAYLEHRNTRLSGDIELFTGRGGKRLLTLEDCFRARQALNRAIPNL